MEGPLVLDFDLFTGEEFPDIWSIEGPITEDESVEECSVFKKEDIQRLFHRIRIPVPLQCKQRSLRVFYQGEQISCCPTCKKKWRIGHRKLTFPCSFRHHERGFKHEPILLQWDHAHLPDTVCEALVTLECYRGRPHSNKKFWVDIH